MPSASLEGQTLGKYRVLGALGAGGMARVYRAYHPGLDRYVAIKVLRSDLVNEPEFLSRFQREAQAVAALRHPHIVQVFDFDVEAETYYMVMELLEGDTLKARLMDYTARGGRMPIDEAAQIMSDTLAGLDYAHSAGIIHRDLKPANLMLTRRGQTVLTDFGIAHILGSQSQTVTGTLMGTINYMAPEQGLQGRYDRRSDLYSLGVVLFEMLTGRVPFDADTPLATLMMHVNEPLPLPRALNPQIPEPFERLILKALSKRPEDRYQSAGEMRQALQAAGGAIGLSESEEAADAPTRPAPAPGVFSGPARADLTDSDFTKDITDRSLETKVRAARPSRPDRRLIAAGPGALVIGNLLMLMLAGFSGSPGRYFATVWPVELLLIAFLLSLLMFTFNNIWFVIPAAFFYNLGALLGYYTLTWTWAQWFWWPAWLLFTVGEILSAISWSRAAPRERPRQIGLALSLLAGASSILLLSLATLIAAIIRR